MWTISTFAAHQPALIRPTASASIGKNPAPLGLGPIRDAQVGPGGYDVRTR